MSLRVWLRHIVSLSLLVVIAAAILLAGPVVRHANAAPGLLYGVEQDGGIDDPTLGPQVLDHQQQLGAKIIRYQLRFDLIATCDPTTKGSPTDPANPCYNWSSPDKVAEGAASRGMQVVFSVMGVPSWEFGGSQGYGYTGTTAAQFAQFQADYTAFVTAAATRYDGKYSGVPRVSYWTIWNEPNGPYFWTPVRVAPDGVVVPQRYAQLYDSSSRAIKAVDPTLKVAAGPLASTSSLKPATFLKAFLPALQKNKSPIDAWAQNAYTRTESPLHSHMSLPEIGLGQLGSLAKILDGYKITKGKPIWITEFSYETAPEVANGVSYADQAQWLADASFLTWASPRVQMFIWYGLFDDGTQQDPTSGFQSGLYASLWSCSAWCAKPSAQMFQHPLWLSDTTITAKQSILIWGQGRVAPTKTKVWYWQNATTGWKQFYNPINSDGTEYLTWQPKVTTWFVTCDTSCGGIQKVTVS